MADTLTPVYTTATVKTFALGTTNTLPSKHSSVGGARRYEPGLGRVFTPDTVVISYQPYNLTIISVSSVSTPANTGLIAYYDPTVVPANVNQYKMVHKGLQNISSMPSWLSTLVLPNI